MRELLYCPYHERAYDATEHQWMPFRRGDLRLVLTVYPWRDNFHVQHNLCDGCLWVSLRCWGRQLASSLARVPVQLVNPAVPEDAR